MTVLVQAKSIPVTQALRLFVQGQAAKIAKFSGKISQITVYLEQIGKRKTNDPTATMVKYHVKLAGKDVIVTRKSKDMYDAIVDATDRAVRQVRKLKEKQKALRTRSRSDEIAQ